MAKFTLEEHRRVGPVLVLGLTGRLVMGDGDEKLDAALQVLINRGERALLLDCAEVSAIDSQGIKALVRNTVSLWNRGGQLKLLRLAPRVRTVLEVTRLLSVIEAFDDEDAALRSF
jgi:anti-sigma B factor antagonist